jgi:hypothetical protein
LKILLIVRRVLSGPGRWRSRYSASLHKTMAAKAYGGVNAFYIVNLFFAYQTMYTLMDTYGRFDAVRFAIRPLWPVFFCTSENLPYIANGLALFYMATSLLVAIWPHLRLARSLVFIAMLQAIAFKYSFGVLNQKEHWWLWTAFIFIGLPTAKYEDVQKSRNLRQYYLDIFSIAQGMALLFYFLSGYWKLYYGVMRFISHSGLGIFSSETLAYMLSDRIASGHVSPFLGQYIIVHPMIGCLLLLWVTYIELGSIMVWFRPALHRSWGVLLILFHIGTWLFMSIPFYMQPPLLALLFLQSPFAPEKTSWKQIAGQLPMIASFICLAQWLVRRSKQSALLL